MSRILSITDVLRDALAARAEPLRTTARALGINHNAVRKFLRGGGLAAHNLDNLAKYLKLELREKHR